MAYLRRYTEKRLATMPHKASKKVELTHSSAFLVRFFLMIFGGFFIDVLLLFSVFFLFDVA